MPMLNLSEICYMQKSITSSITTRLFKAGFLSENSVK
jgi:hypothetical protein